MHSGLVLPTALGPVGMVWTATGLRRVFLPLVRENARDEAEAMERLVKKHAKLVGGGSAYAERVAAHMSGEPVTYDDLALDLEVTPFAMSVYRAAQKIPPGTTVTYADIGREIGNPSARAIGTALGRNPVPIVVPCHRIVSAGGIGGFSAPGGTSTKAQLLAVEGGALGDEDHVIARRHLVKADPLLAPIVKKIPCNLPVKPRGNLFRTIVRAIAGQQLSTKAAATIFGRLEGVIGVVGDTKWATGALANPWPADAANKLLALDDATLRGVGLSGSKMASVRDLSTRVSTGALVLEKVLRLPDERIIEVLTEVRGIGRWTAEMLLIFDLGRPDVLPVDDLGIKKGLQQVHGLKSLPDAAVITKRAEAWRPFRSIGSWYLWRALDAVPS